MATKNKTIGEIKQQLESLVDLLGDFDQQVQADSLKNLSLKQDPYEERIKSSLREHEDVKQENERLKARIKLLESGNDLNVTKRIDEIVNANRKVQELTNKISEFKLREKKIFDTLKQTTREFRAACYLILGFRPEALKGCIYRLSSIYAEKESDKLLFKVSPDGKIQLLENSYTNGLKQYIITYLKQADSFPAFLAAITLDLFKSTNQVSMSQSVSMSLSETIMPNSNYRPTY